MSRVNEESNFCDIEVSPTIVKLVKEVGKDYRLCTSCGYPVLLPTEMRPPKQTDKVIQVGEQKIYVSRNLYEMWRVRKIDETFLERGFCL